MLPGAELERVQPYSSLPEFSNVLLCTDFSETSRAAQAIAVSLCCNRAARLTVMHVSEYGPVPAITDEDLDHAMGLTAKERQQLGAVVDEVRGQGIVADSVYAEGNVASLILDEIERRSIDLAVIGTQVAHVVNRFVFGSTAEAIFRRAPCAVITVGPRLNSLSSGRRGKPVVFATDFGAASIRALAYAASLAEINRSPLHLIHVLPLHDTKRNPTGIREALQTMATRLPADGTMPRCEVVFGSDVSHAVAEYAKAQDASFIAIGVRRKSLVAAHLAPHRTYRIIMTAPCPVLTIA